MSCNSVRLRGTGVSYLTVRTGSHGAYAVRMYSKI